MHLLFKCNSNKKLQCSLRVWLFGEGSGLAACGTEVEQDVGRQGGEGELLGLADQDAGATMRWILCYLALGRLRVGRPVMWRSGRLRVAKAVNGSWVSRMMRIAALDRGLLPPPPCYIALGRVQVCWPAATECRSGSWLAASVPKVAMLDGPVRRIAVWRRPGWLAEFLLHRDPRGFRSREFRRSPCWKGS